MTENDQLLQHHIYSQIKEATRQRMKGSQQRSLEMQIIEEYDVYLPTLQNKQIVATYGLGKRLMLLSTPGNRLEVDM